VALLNLVDHPAEIPREHRDSPRRKSTKLPPDLMFGTKGSWQSTLSWRCSRIAVSSTSLTMRYGC
jgi:hypothetical protein